MNYEPKQMNKAPEAICLAAFLCAIVMLSFSQINRISGKWIMQGLALVFFGIMIYVLVRYKMSAYKYEVAPRTKAEQASAISLPPEQLEFRVYRRQGKRAYIAECVFELDKLVRFEPLPANRKMAKAVISGAGKGQVFRYIQNCAGANRYLLLIKTDTANIKIILEINDDGSKFADYLSAVAVYNSKQ